jgi:hypothetical protein
LAAFAVLTTASALWLRGPLELAALDDVVLRILFPGGLAFILAFAPRPATRSNRIAKDLVVVWLALAVFAGDRVPLMIVAVTGLLAVSVVLASTRFGRALWGEGA